METIDDLTIKYEENGIEVVKELDKAVLSKGAWSTILFKFEEWDDKSKSYKGPKFTIRRYQKRNGAFQQKSKFNISSVDQANKIIEHLTKWVSE